MNAGRACFRYASRSAGNDDAGDAIEVVGGGVDWKDVALYTGFAYAASQQVTVLSARVENCDAVHVEIIVERSAPSIF